MVKNSDPDGSLDPIYHTARVFITPGKYVFDIKDKGTHLIRLHFSRFNLYEFDSYSVKFHVLVNGYVLLYDYSVQNVGSSVKDYTIWVDSDELVIRFIPSSKESIGFVSAIEVISAPKDLIADVGLFVSSERSEEVNGLMRNAFETMYRVNVGGYKVTPFNDSLWRNWVPDDEFLKVSDSSKKVHFGGPLKYQMGGASREVGPDNVYNTGRVITSVTDLVPKSNITWVFPVNDGYKYLVRLHFCDIASVAIGMLYFNVYMNGNLALENLDLSAKTNFMLASPFYADVVVDGVSSGVITISVGSSNMSMPHAVDAILNGVEIMKMSNSVGSLDGLVSAGSLVECRSGRNIGFLASLIAAVLLLLLAPVVLHRRRKAMETVPWSRLPVVDVSEVDLKSNNQINAL